MSNGSDNIPHDPIDSDEVARGADRKEDPEEHYGMSKVPKKKFNETKIGKTILGDNGVGRTIGLGLDLLTLWAPAGGAIDAVRSRAKDALNITQNQNEMKDILKRAFTSDGGGLLRVRDADGKISLVAIGATVIRLALIVGVFKLAEVVGVAPEGILSFIGL